MNRVKVGLTAMPAIAAGFWFMTPPNRTPQQFEDRALRAPTSQAWWKLGPTKASAIPAEAPPNHAQIVARSLLIRDPSVLEDPTYSYDPSDNLHPSVGNSNNAWGFPAILRRVLKLGGGSGADDAAALLWLTSTVASDLEPDRNAFGLIEHEWRSNDLAGAPFRLLAIVNRPDLAQFKPCAACSEDNLARGAEIRFEYGATQAIDGGPVKTPDGRASFSIIVEFVLNDLPKSDFQKYLERWMKLSVGTSTTTAKDLNDLTSDVLDHFVRSARLRLISKDPVTTKWPMREYQISGGAINLGPLSRQLPARETCVPKETSPQLAWWLNQPNNACSVLAANYEFSKPPAASKCSNEDPNVSSDVPTKKAAAFANPLLFQLGTNITETCKNPSRLRTLLELNSCTRCHTTAQLEFIHIQTRARTEASDLSGFLCGVSPCMGPVSTAYFPPGQPAFNDLLRRHEFMLAVAGLKSGDADWTEKLAGLITYQVH